MKRWPTRPLGELLRVQNGFAFKSELFNEDGKGLPIVRIRDLARGFSETFYDGEHDPAFEVENSDFLIGMDGEFRCYRWQGGKALLNQRVCRLQNFSRDLNPGYVFYGINDHLREIEDNTAFVTVKHLSSKQIASIEMSVPPLPEQERIVKLLDEADELRKLRAQADRRTADLIPSLFHEMFGENAKKPHVHVKLEQIAEVVSGVAKGRKFNGRLPVEVPYLRVANVQAGHLDLSEIKTIQALPAEVEELALRKGDVLLTEGGDFDKLGRGAMLERDLPNCIHQNHVFRVRTERSKLDPIYFAQFLLTGEARRYFLGCAKRTTNLASINMTQLRALPVLLPPLALQKEFAARVSDIRAMRAEQAAARRRLDDLFQSMLHRAFQGEL
jgi:type I restriction enzyme, S subunit